MSAYVGRYRAADACVNGIVFEGRTRVHIITAQPDVRLISVDKAREGRFFTQLEKPSLAKAARDLGGAAKRCGITKGARALLKRVRP